MTLRWTMKCMALCAVLMATGAHARFEAYSSYDGRVCSGRLLGVVNRIVDACIPPPAGLGAGCYQRQGRDDGGLSCMSHLPPAPLLLRDMTQWEMCMAAHIAQGVGIGAATIGGLIALSPLTGGVSGFMAIGLLASGGAFGVYGVAAAATHCQ